MKITLESTGVFYRRKEILQNKTKHKRGGQLKTQLKINFFLKPVGNRFGD